MSWNSVSVLTTFSAIFLINFFINSFCVPFVTKRVSPNSAIDMSFGGWRPLKTNPNPSAAEAPLDSHFLTVPVAVETDAEHELSETEISRIRQHIINNWKNAPKKQESFGSHVRQVVEKLIPKPEVELHVDDDRTTAQSRVSSDVSSDASSDMLSSETTNE